MSFYRVFAWKNPELSMISLLNLRSVRAQVLQRNEFECADVRRCEHHRRCTSSFERFLPSTHAQTPAITTFETGKIKLRNRCAEIVAGHSTEAKELVGHHRANRVQPMIAGTRAAVTIAIEAGTRFETAAFEFAT
jgi:hypothetical protein